MPTYRYVKAPPGYTLAKKQFLGGHLKQVISAMLLTLGIMATTTVIYPLVYYQVKLAPRLEDKKAIASTAHITSVQPVKASEDSGPTFVKEMINTTLDYTNSDNWFPEAHTSGSSQPDLTYALTIPKLGIDNAVVVTSHTDLKKSLIQYPGTALPGDLGNTVIFGHSVLPQFFNPHNYLTIFSTLHTLQEGDEIDITADGIDYKYSVVDKYEVQPDNLSPLAQTYDKTSLTIITCTPPGTYLRRLIIKAELK